MWEHWSWNLLNVTKKIVKRVVALITEFGAHLSKLQKLFNFDWSIQQLELIWLEERSLDQFEAKIIA